MEKIMKNFVAAILAMVALLVSGCSSETLFLPEPAEPGTKEISISIKPEKAVVEVEEFSSVTATTVDGLTFDLSDDNRLFGALSNLFNGEVTFTYEEVSDNSRVVNVSYEAATTDGKNFYAYTSYMQKKAGSIVPPTPSTPVDYRLEYDRELISSSEGVYYEMAGCVNAWIVKIYDDGHEERGEQLLENYYYTMYRVPCNSREYRIITSTGERPEEVVYYAETRRDGEQEEIIKNGNITLTNYKFTEWIYNYELIVGIKTNMVFNYQFELNDFAFSTLYEGKELSFSYKVGEYTSSVPEGSYVNKELSDVVDTNEQTTVTHHYLGTYVMKFHQYINGEEIEPYFIEANIYKEGEYKLLE